MVAIFFVPMRAMGYGTDWKAAAVTTWGGLRGIVGIIIALVIRLDDGIGNRRFSGLCVFYMARAVLLPARSAAAARRRRTPTRSASQLALRKGRAASFLAAPSGKPLLEPTPLIETNPVAPAL